MNYINKSYKEYLLLLLLYKNEKNIICMNTLNELKNFVDELPRQGRKMPVLFTSHGNPMDIPVPKEQRLFWWKHGSSFKIDARRCLLSDKTSKCWNDVMLY